MVVPGAERSSARLTIGQMAPSPTRPCDDGDRRTTVCARRLSRQQRTQGQSRHGGQNETYFLHGYSPLAQNGTLQRARFPSTQAESQWFARIPEAPASQLPRHRARFCYAKRPTAGQFSPLRALVHVAFIGREILQPPVSHRQQRNHAGCEIETGADAAFGRVQSGEMSKLATNPQRLFAGGFTTRLSKHAAADDALC